MYILQLDVLACDEAHRLVVAAMACHKYEVNIIAMSIAGEAAKTVRIDVDTA